VPAHPVFHLPDNAGTAFTGADFSRATVTGDGLTALLAGTGANAGKIVLAELDQGAGQVLFGGMSLAQFHSPQPQADNLRSNILTYLRPPLVPVPQIVVEQPAGTGIPDGGSRDFGAVTAGANSSLTFVIRNIGRADLTNLVITKDGPNAADFTVMSKPSSLVTGPSGQTSFTVRFTPSAVGPSMANLHIASNDPTTNPFELVLTGSGLPAIAQITVEKPKGTALVPGGTTTFGSVVLRKKKTLTFAVHNTGTASLGNLAVTLSGANAAEFKLTAKFTAALKPGASKTFTVQFAPTTAGVKQAALVVVSNDADPGRNPWLVNLTATATASHSATDKAVEAAGEIDSAQ